MAHQKKLLDIFVAGMQQGASLEQRKIMERLRGELMSERQADRQDWMSDMQAQRDADIAQRQQDRDAAIHARMVELQEQANKDAQANAWLADQRRRREAETGHGYRMTEIAERNKGKTDDEYVLTDIELNRIATNAARILGPLWTEMQEGGESKSFIDDAAEYRRQGYDLLKSIEMAADQPEYLALDMGFEYNPDDPMFPFTTFGKGYEQGDLERFLGGMILNKRYEEESMRQRLNWAGFADHIRKQGDQADVKKLEHFLARPEIGMTLDDLMRLQEVSGDQGGMPGIEGVGQYDALNTLPSYGRVK